MMQKKKNKKKKKKKRKRKLSKERKEEMKKMRFYGRANDVNAGLSEYMIICLENQMELYVNRFKEVIIYKRVLDFSKVNWQ